MNIGVDSPQLRWEVMWSGLGNGDGTNCIRSVVLLTASTGSVMIFTPQGAPQLKPPRASCVSA